MSGFLLDTNVLSEFARSLPADQRVDGWLRAAPEQELFASVLTFAEIRFGIEILPTGKRRLQLEGWLDDLRLSFELRLLPVTRAISERWAVLSAQAHAARDPSVHGGWPDCGDAIEHGHTLVTRNVKDFAGFGIELLNPWEA